MLFTPGISNYHNAVKPIRSYYPTGLGSTAHSRERFSYIFHRAGPAVFALWAALIFFAGFGTPSAARGDTRLTVGRVRRLLAGQGQGDDKHLFGEYTLQEIDLSTPGAILLKLESTFDQDLLEVRLTARDESAGAFCRTESFNVVYLRGTRGKTTTPENISVAMKALCSRLEKNDDHGLRLGRFTPPVSESQRGKSTLQPKAGLVSILIPACLFMLLFVTTTRSKAYALLKNIESFFDRRPLPFLFAIMVGSALILASSLYAPFDADYMTQRVFFGSLELGRIITHDYPDSRHPPLFYLILSPFHLLGPNEWIMRLPAALFGIASIAMLFFFLRRSFGGFRSLTATAFAAFSVPFLRHAGDVSDITLFTFLCLASSHVFFLLMESESEDGIQKPALPEQQKGFVEIVRTTAGKIFPRYNESSFKLLILWIFLETAMLWSYYLAPGVVAAHLLTALIYKRKPQGKAVLRTFPVIALLAAPVLWSGFKAIAADFVTRTTAREFPLHIWGDKTPLQLWEVWVELLASSTSTALVVFFLAAAGAIRWMSKTEHRPKAFFTSVLTSGGILFLGIGVLWLRLNAYYLVFLLPIFAALLTAGSMGLPDQAVSPVSKPRRLSHKTIGLPLHKAFFVGLSGALGLYAALAHGMRLHSEVSEQTLYRRNDAFSRAGEFMRSGPKTIVTDPDCLHTILLYYTFDDPVKGYRTCRFTPSMPVHCSHRDRELYALTAMGSMEHGWEKTAIQRFHSIFRKTKSFRYVRTDRFPNPELTRIVEKKCKKERSWPPLTVYLCKTR